MMTNGGLRPLQFDDKRARTHFLGGVAGNEGKKLQANGVTQCCKDLGKLGGVVVGE